MKRAVILSLSLFFFAACGYSGPKVSVSVLKATIESPDSSILVVDVRPRSLYKKGHVPSAVNIPLAEIEGRASELAAHQGEIAIMCNCGRMALKALKILSDKNITAALVVGGFKEWTAAGYPVEKGSQSS